MNALTEYSSPLIYESEYGDYTDDFDIFCSTVTKGEALDIACGTGRITTKLAEIGLKCTGIDSSDPMLKFLLYGIKLVRRNGIKSLYGFMEILRLAIYLWMAANSLQSLILEELQLVIPPVIL